MGTKLADLVAELQDAVPAKSGVPSTAQYARAVQRAVNDFSGRAAMRKSVLLDIVSGTATYTLPADFLKLIRFDSLWNPTGIVQVGEEIIPLSSAWEDEEINVAGQTLTISPTPAYSLKRRLTYAAGYVLTGTGEEAEYADMGADVAGIVMLKAQATALKLQGNASAGKVASFSFADVSINRSQVPGEQRAQAQAFESEYEATVLAYNAAAGSRQEYDAADRAALDHYLGDERSAD